LQLSEKKDCGLVDDRPYNKLVGAVVRLLRKLKKYGKKLL